MLKSSFLITLAASVLSTQGNVNPAFSGETLAGQRSPPDFVIYPVTEGHNVRVAEFFKKGLSKIMDLTGTGWTFRTLPNTRADQQALLEPDACIAGVMRFRAVLSGLIPIGPIIETSLVLAARPGLDVKLTDLTDARPYRVGVLLGTYMFKQLENSGISVEAVANDHQNFDKLELGRIDFWYAGRGTVEATAQDAGKPAPSFAYESPAVPLYFGCNPDMPPSKRAILRDALSQFHGQHRPDWKDMYELKSNSK